MDVEAALGPEVLERPPGTGDQDIYHDVLFGQASEEAADRVRGPTDRVRGPTHRLGDNPSPRRSADRWRPRGGAAWGEPGRALYSAAAFLAADSGPRPVARSISVRSPSLIRQTYSSSTCDAISSANPALNRDWATCRTAAIGRCGGRIKWSSRVVAGMSTARAVSKSLFGLSAMMKLLKAGPMIGRCYQAEPHRRNPVGAAGRSWSGCVPAFVESGVGNLAGPFR
jgi:hypothetical protein